MKVDPLVDVMAEKKAAAKVLVLAAYWVVAMVDLTLLTITTKGGKNFREEKNELGSQGET